MATTRVSFDFGSLPAKVQAALHQAVADVDRVVQHTADQVQMAWTQSVAQAPGVQAAWKDAYIKSIQVTRPSPSSAVVQTDFPHASDIDNGQPARDLKRMLQTSKKVRIVQGGKNAGKRYLIIPLRHNTPGHSAHARAMPAHVYAQAQALPVSRVTGMGTRTSASGHTVAQAQYKWGGRLSAGLTPKLKPHHTTDIHAGMVKMDTSSGKQKSSAYMTFRTMGEWQSDKWLVGPKPGLHIIRDVSDFAETVFKRNMQHFLSQTFGV